MAKSGVLDSISNLPAFGSGPLEREVHAGTQSAVAREGLLRVCNVRALQMLVQVLQLLTRTRQWETVGQHKMEQFMGGGEIPAGD